MSAEQLPADLARQVEAALREDIGSGDVTAALVPAAQQVQGRVISREATVLCGSPWVDETFRQLDARVQLTWHAREGAALSANATVFDIAGGQRVRCSPENVQRSISCSCFAAPLA